VLIASVDLAEPYSYPTVKEQGGTLQHTAALTHNMCPHFGSCPTCLVLCAVAALQHTPVNGCEAAPNVHLVHIWHDSADLLERARIVLALRRAEDTRSVHRLQRTALERLPVMHLPQQRATERRNIMQRAVDARSYTDFSARRLGGFLSCTWCSRGRQNNEVSCRTQWMHTATQTSAHSP
jgi:hypothetical protein